MSEAIEALIKEKAVWLATANELQVQRQEALKNAEVIQQAISLIKQRTDMPQTAQLPLPKISEKYKDMTMTDAIHDILKHEENPNGSEVYERLTQNGFSSNSKNVKRDVYTRLYRLAVKEKKILASGSRGNLRYSLPEVRG